MLDAVQVSDAPPETSDADRSDGEIIDRLYRCALFLSGDEAVACALVEAAIDRAGTAGGRGFSLVHCLRAVVDGSGALGAGPQLAIREPECASDPELAPVLAAFRGLPRELRVPAALYFTQDLTSRQVAAIMDASVESVRTRLGLARRCLADTLSIAA
jgi:hypothetical protein